MARVPRSEWPLIAAGVTAGLIVSTLMLYLFFTGIGGEPVVDPALVSDTTQVVETSRRQVPDAPGAPAGLIGARQSGIERRLTALAVSARPLRGPLRVTMRDVVWNEPNGTRFARADGMTGQLNVAAAQRGDIVMDDVVLRRPVVQLTQGTAGTWNHERVFAELLEGAGEPRPGPVRTFRLRNVRIVDGDVDVTRPERRFALEDVQATLPVVSFSQPGIADPFIRAAQVTLVYTQPEPQGRLAIELTDGFFQFPSGTTRFEVAAATLERTQVADIRGTWDPAQGGYGLTANGRALGVEFEDVAFLLPEFFPATGQATFAWAVRPLPADRTEVIMTELEAVSGESRVLGSLTMNVGVEYFELRDADLRLDPVQLALVEGFTGPLPYGGALTGAVRGTGGDITFELDARLTAPNLTAPFSTALSGRVLISDDGFALQRLDVGFDRVPLAALRAVAPGLPLSGFATGTVTLTGLPTQSPLDVDVRLELGTGVATVQGTVDLRGEVPSYDVTGRLLGIDLRSVLEPAVPPVSVTADFALRGSGTDPALMDADVRVAGRFTGWEAGPGDTIQLVAAVRQGVLRVENMSLALATAAVSASGDWRFVEPQSGAVTYALDITSLRPFGPWLPVVGDTIAAGSLRAAGSLTGSLSRMRLAGELEATEVRVGAWRALALAGEYDVQLGGALPEAVVEATGRGIGTPTAGEFATAELSVRLTPPSLVFDVDAVRPDGGVVQVAGTGTLPETGPREVIVQQARFDMANGRWTLEQPATIVWTEAGTVSVQGLVLEEASSDGRLMLEGFVLPRGDVDARFEVVAIPVGDIQRLIGRDPLVEGILSASGTVRGARADPLVDVAFRLDSGEFRGVPVQTLEGRIDYSNELTDIRAVAVIDTLGRLDMQVSLPSVLELGGDPQFRLIDGAPMSGSITADEFALSPFGEMFPEVRDVTGVIDARVDLAGSADQPQVTGSFVLDGGGVTVVEMNQRYSEITGTLTFDGRRLLVSDLKARSDGWLVIGGQIVLERIDRPVLDLTVLFEGFRPMGVENQRDAALFGQLALTGPPDGLELTGSMRLDDGYLNIPQMGPASAFEFDITQPLPLPSDAGQPVEAGPDIWRNLSVSNLRVTVGDGAWFIAEQARAQVAGELVVSKTGEATPIVGTLSGTRGQYTLIAGPIIRRFDIVAAQVRFLGNPTPNPSIDITARRIVVDPGGRQLDIDVRISGTMDNARLSLAGGEGAAIAESELLSFLIFGQPTFALGGDILPGDALLEQTFVGGFAELMAIELERSLGGFGLDIFQIRLGQGPLGGLGAPTLVLGRQLAPDVFLTVETGINALFGGAGDTPVNTWAVRLDWAFDTRSRLRLAFEPVYRGRMLRGAGLALPLSDPRQQFLVELRRRWTY